MKKQLLLIATQLLVMFNLVNAQLTVATETPANLVQNVLLGGGISASNITSQGSALQFGTFSGTGSNIGLTSGVVLSTCRLNSANELASGDVVSNGAGTNGDAQLQSLSNGSASFNAAIIQFDFIPTGDTLKFDYVFASAEYNMFVDAGYNDVFAFFLTGPNPDPLLPAYNNTNIALIPGTTTPVSIDNVNNGNSFTCGFGPCTNCAYFVDNCVGTSVAFGGFTVPLTAIAPVVPCSTYTIRLGIADIGDGAYNSAVFLKAGSFGTGGVELSSEVKLGGHDSINTDNYTLYKGCTNAELTFIRKGDLTNSDTVFFTVGGTAQEGVDYTIVPAGTMLVFLPGQDTAQIIIDPINNTLPNDGYTIKVEIIDSNLCQNTVKNSLTLTIREVHPLLTQFITDTICTGDTVMLAGVYTGGTPYVDIVWANGIPDSGLYVSPQSEYIQYTIHDICADTLVSDSIYIHHHSDPAFQLDDQVICEGFSTQIGIPDSVHYTFLWNTMDTTSFITVSDSGTYFLTVTNICNVVETDTMHLSFISNVGEFPMPNIITPNNDGVNDEYFIQELTIAESFELFVYNRWGRLIYSTSDVNALWKGEGDGGSEATDGTYYVVLNYVSCNGKKFNKTSFVQLMRNN